MQIIINNYAMPLRKFDHTSSLRVVYDAEPREESRTYRWKVARQMRGLLVEKVA
jgi:hypothetical protein